MKRFLSILSIFALSFGFFACSDDDDPIKDPIVDPTPTPEPEPETENANYTVMLYGCGGGNLDEEMVTNLEEALLVGSNDRVRMTGQIKFSAQYQSDPDLKGTIRFLLNDANSDDEYDYIEVYEDEFALYDPDNLADFITWSKEMYPADNYILVLWNHGGGWMPNTDMPKTRAVIFDDNMNGQAMSIDELVEGVEKSNTHFKMIYYDACLMAMLENYCSLVDIADYALGAAHTTPGIGGNYTSLLELLATDDDFETIMGKYMSESMSLWSIVGYAHDFTLIDLSKMGEVTTVLKDVAEELVASYDDYQQVYDAVLSDENYGVYRYEADYPFFDVVDYVNKLAAYSSNPSLIGYATRLQRAFNEAIVHQELSTTLKTNNQAISLGVTLLQNGMWDNGGYQYLMWDGSVVDIDGEVIGSWGSTGDETYAQLPFDQATGWSQWLQLNEQEPIGLCLVEPDDEEGDAEGEEGEVVEE